jgi:glyoxylase-like metal-dependent hydrolase (beta-lactamase superfamily II)
VIVIVIVIGCMRQVKAAIWAGTRFSISRMSSLVVKCFFEPVTFTCQYVVHDGAHCAIVDSVLDLDEKAGRTSHKSCDELVAYVREHKLTCDWILDTHVHADHLTGAHHLKSVFPRAVYCIGEHVTTVLSKFKGVFDLHRLPTDGSQFDRLLKEGDVLQIGSVPCRVLHTPGHTPACVTYVLGADEAAIVGDTIFAPDYGTARCDFPNGSAHQLWQSIQKILALPDACEVYMCHDYLPGGRPMVFKSTIGEERKNVHLSGKTEDEFVAFREARDKTLAVPKLLLPSIQVNCAAGELPSPAPGDSHAYLKLPLNVI